MQLPLAQCPLSMKAQRVKNDGGGPILSSDTAEEQQHRTAPSFNPMILPTILPTTSPPSLRTPVAFPAVAFSCDKVNPLGRACNRRRSRFPVRTPHWARFSARNAERSLKPSAFSGPQSILQITQKKKTDQSAAALFRWRENFCSQLASSDFPEHEQASSLGAARFSVRNAQRSLKPCVFSGSGQRRQDDIEPLLRNEIHHNTTPTLVSGSSFCGTVA
ncbi:hypothetical protein B0H14DRAFT_2597280 [Mycena olivaceomarginata]|nr:hypothetical protein B0H14DRAFT_2597280 [Mycena olivaceomarginata]